MKYTFYITFLILFLLSIIVEAVQAQQSKVSEGIVVYRQKIDMIYPDIQKDTLRFNHTKSLFYWNTANYTGDPGLQAVKKRFPNAEDGGNISGPKPVIYYGIRVNLYDSRKDSLYSLMGMKYINKLIYLKEKAPEIDWTINDSTKQVGNYEVKKATAHFRGRDYTAWFTTEIPVPYGPWKLHGLPGLILQAYDQSGNIYFSATDISNSNINSIGPIALTGLEQTVTLAGYIKILNHYKQYQKQQLMKITRQIKGISKEDRASMQYQVQPIKHMEIFDDYTTEQ